MKYLVLCAFFFVVEGKVLPDRVSNLLCRKSDPDWDKCIKTSFEKSISQLVKGVPETHMPPIDPLELPFVSVDRTINELVSISAILKNIKVDGISGLKLEHLRTNPYNYTAELRFTVPWAHLEMDYDVSGQLLIIPLRSKGFFNGNFTNIQVSARGNLKTVDKNGVKYFKVDKLNTKIRIGDGQLKLIAENPDLQFEADLITNFYNDNPRDVMDAINPIFVESATELYRVFLDQIIGTVPAKEWLPE